MIPTVEILMTQFESFMERHISAIDVNEECPDWLRVNIVELTMKQEVRLIYMAP
jgi:hypothetical protein